MKRFCLERILALFWAKEKAGRSTSGSGSPACDLCLQCATGAEVLFSFWTRDDNAVALKSFGESISEANGFLEVLAFPQDDRFAGSGDANADFFAVVPASSVVLLLMLHHRKPPETLVDRCSRGWSADVDLADQADAVPAPVVDSARSPKLTAQSLALEDLGFKNSVGLCGAYQWFLAERDFA
jgi:hypothetical protein